MAATDFGLDPELAVQEQLLAQKQALADQFTKRGSQSIHVNSGTISPLQAAAQMLNAHYGATARKDVATRTTAMGEDYTRRLQEGVQDYMRAKQGTGVQPDPQEFQQSADQGTPRPAPAAGDPRAAMVTALLSRNPAVRALGNMDYQHELKKTDPYTLAPDAKRVIPASNGQPGSEVLNPKGPQHAIPTTWKSMLPQGASRQENDPDGVFRLPGTDGQSDVYYMQFDHGALTGYKKMDSSQVTRVTNNNPAPVTAVTIRDPNDPTGIGTIIVDGRTGKKIGDGPKVTDQGKLVIKRDFNMQGIGATIKSAEDLLKGEVLDKNGKPLPKPTGSSVGAVVDAAGALIGKTVKGSAEADKLRSLGGALVSKMPRMEGPQSDKDVALYKEMAGRIGDPTIPRERRIAALDEVKNLWQKYEKLNPEHFADRRAAPAEGSVLKFDAQGNPLP